MATALAVRPATVSRRHGPRGAWARRGPLLPALVFMIIVTQLPFVATLVMSFLNWSAQPDAPGKSFAGLSNFKEV